MRVSHALLDLLLFLCAPSELLFLFPFSLRSKLPLMICTFLPNLNDHLAIWIIEN